MRCYEFSFYYFYYVLNLHLYIKNELAKKQVPKEITEYLIKFKNFFFFLNFFLLF